MNTIKVYLYDSNATDYKGTDYTSYVVQGAGNIEKLNSEVDTSTIVLQGLSFREEFTPHTMFVIDECFNDDIINTWHRVVQQDTVSQPILSDNNYFTHTIALSEPSIVAQQRLVDNVSITYKLKDVSLKQVELVEVTKEMVVDTKDEPTLNPSIITRFGKVQETTAEGTIINTYSFGKYIDWTPSRSGATKLVEICDANGENITDKYFNNIATYPQIKFIIPRAGIRVGIPSSTGSPQFSTIRGYASISWLIREYAPTDTQGTVINSGYFFSNSNLTGSTSEISFPYKDFLGTTTNLEKHWLLEKVEKRNVGSSEYWTSVQDMYKNSPYFYFKQYTDDNGSNLSNQTLYTDAITPQAGYTYELQVRLYDYYNDIPYSGRNADKLFRYNSTFGIGKFKCAYEWDSRYYNVSLGRESSYYNERAKTKMGVYSTNETAVAILSSAVPYSALSMIKKALINTNVIRKQSNIKSVDINHRDANGVLDFDCPFYIDDAYLVELALTQVNETFYNQKNLWEVLIEVGNYIHAIPEIKFGENNKFMITFNKLGETTQYENKATKMTIMNFKGVDDYICATNSYVSNMVQLGGQITEYVSPKTSSDTKLVSNDTIEIHTSKPIIELLSVKVIPLETFTPEAISGITSYPLNYNTKYDITEYVYEKNIYDLLSVSYNDLPNKGIALYYELGDNIIKGGNYQLPRANTDLYSDYTIKKVIYLGKSPNPNTQNTYPIITPIPATGPWVYLKANNFVFEVTYRTKDDVRQNHTRPDIRKYLLNSKFDNVPQHNQFNNQEDILVDSIAFGSKMFGTLVRTGNTTYQETEWVDNPTNLKHKGELYYLYDNLYYVSQVSNTYYADHIVSQVEYSKDYNQLSQIIGIPSEPRFYEISEQSSIRRDVNVQDYILITKNYSNLVDLGQTNYSTGYIYDIDSVINLMLFRGEFPKWAITTFKGDNEMGNESDTFGEYNLVKHVISPINAYTSGLTLTYEWDMVDNFGAGDYTSAITIPTSGGTEEQANKSYRTLRSYQYCDKYGKATLMDFYILGDKYDTIFFNKQNVLNLPQSPINPWNGTTSELKQKNIHIASRMFPYTADGQMNSDGLVLLKDCREAISVNYNLSAITDSDTIVLSPFLFTPSDEKPNTINGVKLVCLNKEIDKLSNGYINTENIINIKDTSGQYIENRTLGFGYYQGGTHYQYSNSMSPVYSTIGLIPNIYELNEQHFAGGNLDQIRAIAFVYGDITDGKVKLTFGQNIPSTWTKETTGINTYWYFGTPKKEFFTNRQ